MEWIHKILCEWWRHWQFPKHWMSIFTYCFSEMTSRNRHHILHNCSKWKWLDLKWNVIQNPMWNTAHQCTQLFQRNRIQHTQCRCNAHCSCMIILIIINFVEYKCSQVVFSNSALKSSIVIEFSKILLGWQLHHMVYLNYLKHLSDQDFIIYKHLSLLFHTAHLTVNTQYYKISSHVAATAF